MLVFGVLVNRWKVDNHPNLLSWVSGVSFFGGCKGSQHYPLIPAASKHAKHDTPASPSTKRCRKGLCNWFSLSQMSRDVSTTASLGLLRMLQNIFPNCG